MMTSEEGIKWLVGVRCYTYNQSRYIIDAMNGFVMQQTDFPFVCCIVDDASTDGEQEVIIDYLKEFFDLQDVLVAFEKDEEYGYVTFARHKTNENCYFAVTFLKENHHSQKKAKLPYLKKWLDDVKYIAICEGDDYWTEPLKLQKQVSYMESHPNCNMCVHATIWEEEGKKTIKGCDYPEDCDLTTEEIIRFGGLYIAMASTIYKRDSYPVGNNRPLWWRMSDVGDYPLHIYAALNGVVHFLSEPMCVYRFQHEGSWTYNQGKRKDIKHAQCEVTWMNILDRETGFKYSNAIQCHLYRFNYLLYNENELSTYQYYQRVCRTGIISNKKFIKQVVKKVFKSQYDRYCYFRNRHVDAN